MVASSIAHRLAKGQDDRTSFIASVDDREAIARTVCGLLNSGDGGTVFVGVDSMGKPMQRGLTVEEGRALEAVLQSEISPSALYSVSVDTLKEGSVFTIDVPPGSDRPYVVRGAIWVRHGTAIQPAAAEDIRGMFASAEQSDLRWERRISTGMEERDLDLSLVRRVRAKAEEAGRLVLGDAETELEMLGELSLYRSKGFTNACDVLFARKPSQRLPQTRVQLLEFRGDKTDDSYDDYRWFEGSAIELVEQIFTALQSHKKTRARFVEGLIERDEQPAYHDFPLREGIVNALAHRSYESYSGGVKVSVYRDRIEFWNTGRLPPEISIKDLPRKHQSYPVNPDIAHAFYLNRFMERTGRGTERIAEACKQIGAPPPVWMEDQGGVTLVLYAALSADEAVATRFNERQRAFLDAVQPGESIALVDYIERFAEGISDRQARRDMTELEKYRLVRREGRSVATTYRRLKG